MGITTTDCIVCNPHYDCHSTFLLDGENSSPLLWAAVGLYWHMAMVSELDVRIFFLFLIKWNSLERHEKLIHIHSVLKKYNIILIWYSKVNYINFIYQKGQIQKRQIHLPSPYVNTIRRQLIAGDLNLLHLKEM